MASWQRRLAPLIHAVEQRFDALKYRIRRALGGPGPLRIAAYRGYGTTAELHLKGRVLEDRGIEPPGEEESAWQNLQDMFKRMASKELPHARLLARFRGVEQEVQADEEGMFEVTLRLPEPLDEDGQWHPVELRLVDPRLQGRDPVVSEGQVLVPPRTARFGVISDIDDTVVQTNVADLLQAARTIMLGSARTRLPFPGVATFYRALHAGLPGQPGNPLFFVSNGPWNLYDVLLEFLNLQGIPPGPVLMRNWGVYPHEFLPTESRAYKLDQIRPILETYPDLPFILVGDSGEEDPEIYAQVVAENQDRILAVYIRDVVTDADPAAIEELVEKVRQAGSTLILAKDSMVMARHAADQGWIPADSLPAIKAEVFGL
ncbi:MAG TPA: phosphatase domain-containing protein [Anaerolineae bacterium]|nr:phosphatase domain-containing protein [Anaerolineae bacterium]